MPVTHCHRGWFITASDEVAGSLGGMNGVKFSALT